MAKAWVLPAVLWVALGSGWAQTQGTAAAPASGNSAAPVKKTCTVDSSAPNAAETALSKRQNGLAETLFRAMLAKDVKDGAAHEGLVRALIAEDRVADAARDAEAWAAAEPGSSIAMTALADVRLRQGDPRAAFLQYQSAVRAELCNARAMYGLSEVDRLAGLFASRKVLIERAHLLHPTDDDVYTAWLSTRARKERLERWSEYAAHSDQINDEDRAKLKTRLEKESLYHASDCRATAASPETATVPMQAIMDGPNRLAGWGLDVKFNGKGRRLEIDTGASGITISRAAALFLGIVREDEVHTQGIGDKGAVRTSVTHVASVKIGGIEFTNCAVEILEKWSVLESDGLIGGDVFNDHVLTLDFPKHELRLAPLPVRPGAKAPRESLDAAADEEEPEAHDPYTAPEMAKWQRIYRSGHELLMPTGLVDTKHVKDTNAWKDKLFLLDTGSDSNLISPAAAKEVTKVGRDESVEIRGISGAVEKVYEAGDFTLFFAGLRLDSPRMTAIDMTSLSHDTGVEVSGLIGAPALFQVVMHIDYRDNLVWCEYTAKK